MNSPVYLKIVDDIKKKINTSELKPGDILSSESTLCKQYGASRMTVRKGLAVLVSEGYIYSIPGKGNFVKKPEQNKYVIYYDEMNNSISSVDKSRLLEVSIIVPDEKLADDLQISRSKNIIMIRRLFFTDGAPVAYDVKYLIYHRGMPVIEKEIENSTFAEMLYRGLPEYAFKKELAIHAQMPDREMKKLLNLYDGLALLVVEQKFYSSKNKPIGLGKTYFRGDYIKLQGISEPKL